MRRLTVREAVPGDRAGIRSVSADALAALAGSPSVDQWGRLMRQGFVEHHVAKPGPRVVVVAELDSVVIGVGSVTPRRRHPHDFMRIEVAGEWRRKGVGSAVFAALIEREAGPLTVREMLSDHHSVDFYTNRGFVTGEVATEGIIVPWLAQTSRWLDRELSASDGIDVVPIAGSGLDDETIARAVDDFYMWIHPHSPPQALGGDAAVSQYLAAWRREAGFVALRAGGPIGVGLLGESPFRTDTELAHLVWCGVRRPDTPQAAEVTRALLAACLDVARRRRWRVEVEVNHPHEYLVDAVERVPGAQLFQDLTMLVSRYGG